MGQHTWFLKNRDLYLKQQELYDKLDSFETGDIYLDKIEVEQLEYEIDKIDELNDAEYHDLFRTSKKNPDDTYIEDVIFSRQECFDWINNPDNKVSFKNTMFDTDEQEAENRKRSIKILGEFWDKYPSGVIYFG